MSQVLQKIQRTILARRRPKRAALRLDEAGCNGESDKLAWAGVCGLGRALGSLRWKARLESGQLPLAHAMVKTAHEARRGARPAEAWLPDPAPVQDPGCFTCVYCDPWRGAFAGSLLWRESSGGSSSDSASEDSQGGSCHCERFLICIQGCGQQILWYKNLVRLGRL